MIHLTGVLAAAGEVQAFCRSRGWRFCFIGGVALQRWGEPRFTQDVDLTLLTGFGGEEAYVDALLQEFKPRRHDAKEFALRWRVLLIETHKGISVDAALGALPFEERTVQRASEWAWEPNRNLITCSAEDLLVHKVFAGRDLDWADAERVLTRQYGKLNLAQIHQELEPLLELKGETGALAKLDGMISRIDYRLRAKI
jgi:hypothetical protein